MNLPPLRTLFFEDLSIGMTERLEKTVASSDVVGFAQLTGDRNPIHLSEHFAAKTSFRTRIAGPHQAQMGAVACCDAHSVSAVGSISTE